MVGKLLNPLLKRVINTESDDFHKVVLLQLAIFLIISVLMILKPLATSLMLSAYGIDVMPVAFVSIAIAALIIHYILILLRRSFALYHAIVINFAFHIILLTVITAAVNFRLLHGPFTVAVYVYISLFSVITVTLFFQYCQSLLSIREAKRVLSHIGVGAIGGGVFGGYFASGTVSYFGNIGLLVSAIVFLFLSAMCIRKVHIEFGSDLMEDAKESEWIGGGQFLRTLKNKHVIYIVGITCFGVIASKLLDYLFNAVAYNHFDTQEALTAFFGFWFSSINVIGLIIQLFFVNTVIDRLGITYSMSIMPMLILGSLIAFLYWPILAVGIIMKMVDGSMKQSVYKTSTEINIMPLSAAIRERAKSLIDVVVDSIATGLSGVLIYILINRVSLPLWVITLTTILVVIAWVSFILLSKKTYLKQLSYLVYSDDSDDSDDEELTVTPLEYLQHLLKDNRRNSINRLEELKRFTVEAETPVRSAAIEIIGQEYKSSGLLNVSHLQDDKSYIVRKKYFEEKLKFVNSKSELKQLYSTATPENRIIITGALARLLGSRWRQQERYQIKKRINQAYAYMNNNDVAPKLWRTWMTAVAHTKFEKYYPVIKDNLRQSAEEDMKMFALFAVRRGKLKLLFPTVLTCKVSFRKRKRWHKTLSAFPNLLLRHLKSLPEENSKKLKKFIPAFKFIDKQSHLDFLFDNLEHKDRGVRIEVVKTIGIMRLRYPYLKYNRRRNRLRLNKNIVQIKEILGEIWLMNDLIDQSGKHSKYTRNAYRALLLLKNELNINLHVLFVLLGLVTDSDEMMKCYYGLIRGRRQATLDYLDQLLSYRLKTRILPLLKLATVEEIDKALFLENGVKISKRTTADHLKRLSPSIHRELKVFI